MAFAPEVFRDRLSAQADFSVIRDALAVPAPHDEADPYDKLNWVAKTIEGVTEGLHYARMGVGFGMVYGNLSGNIRDDLNDFSQPEALGRAAIIFLGYWTRPTGAAIRYLQGDDAALQNMSVAWGQVQLDYAVLKSHIGLGIGLGVNTHIVSRDLAKSVFEAVPPAEYYDDYKNEVKNKISNTVDSLAGAFIPGHPYVRQKIATSLKTRIAVGRDHAWEASELAMEYDGIEQQELIWARLDKQAALNNARIKFAGGSALSLALMTERVQLLDLTRS